MSCGNGSHASSSFGVIKIREPKAETRTMRDEKAREERTGPQTQLITCSCRPRHKSKVAYV